MKKIALYIMFLFAVQLVAAQSFEKGNALYKEGNYASAAAQYEGILKQKKESAEIYFNLGNAYYKMGEVAPAVYNYKKALLLHPGYKEAQVNLGFAQKMAIDDIKAVPRVGFSKMVYNAASNFHYNTWAWIALGFAGLFFLFFLGYYFGGSTLIKRIFFVGMFIGIGGSVVGVLSAIYVKSHFEAERPAVVFAEVVSVKEEPRDMANDAFILHEGTQVNVEETVGDWKKIQLADESVGWIKSGAIKEVKN
ncbi:tetratricopeptide repeat protein [Flavobacterium rhizosphaerae]|uniref:Tetratricopeptide repeat protein n=1 Tax=Flavobacterium rhizosphaerae TaxID=3163298 RepID=A0ABW8YYQ7_9FLAO